MKFTGTGTINAEPEAVYDFLTDPHQVAECAPMMQDVKFKNNDEFEFKISASGFKIGFTVRWTERERPNLIRSAVEGGNRMIGKASLQNEFRIKKNEDNHSQIDWTTDATVTGMIGNMVDQEQLTTLVEKLNNDVIDCARQKLE